LRAKVIPPKVFLVEGGFTGVLAFVDHYLPVFYADKHCLLIERFPQMAWEFEITGLD